ncbi:MAG: cation:proton antiporter [Candidatus Promineifilaceae bacterium]
MHQPIIIEFAIIVVLGITAQWLAWRFKLPAILLLLLFGFIAGPIAHLVLPDEHFGELLFPFVSISVGIILFEGGLSLRFDELRGAEGVVRLLVTLGALITWGVVAAAARFVLGMDLQMAVLLGAILVVTGPTVVIPLLRQVRPSQRVSSILKWEGILIDPIGAVLAVLVFEAILESGTGERATFLGIVTGAVFTLAVGTLVGVAFAYVLTQFLKRNWIATFLETAVALMAVLAAFAIANALRPESGLMAVTAMGIYLANQKSANISHITSFKEELGVLLLSALFIVLAARIDLGALINVAWSEVVFVLVIILVARPLSVFASTIFSGIPLKEKAFISAMAPRGIVAVSVASLFAIELEDAGYAGAEQLVNNTFTVVVATVIIYSIVARPLAKWLGLVQQRPQGTLVVGAHHWARQIAAAIKEADIDVWLVDTNGRHIENALNDGLTAVQDSIMADGILDDLPLQAIGRLLALTDNNELNALAALRFSEWLGEDHVFQLASVESGTDKSITERLRGRILFDDDLTFNELEKFYYRDAQVVLLQKDAAQTLAALEEQGIFCQVLFLVTPQKHLLVNTSEQPLTVGANDQAIVLVARAGATQIAAADNGAAAAPVSGAAVSSQ